MRTSLREWWDAFGAAAIATVALVVLCLSAFAADPSGQRRLTLLVAPMIGILLWNNARAARKRRQLQRELAAQSRHLADSERFFRSLTDVLPAMIGYWDRDLRNLFANQSYLAWFGRSPAELRGAHISQLLGAEQFEAERSAFDAALAGQTQILERTVVRPDGSIGTLLVTLKPDVREGKVHGLFAHGADITNRKATEQALRKQAGDLDDLYNSAPCGYHSIGPDGLVLHINDTELRWLGLAREEVVGKMRLADLLTPESAKKFGEIYPLYLAQGEIHDLEMEFLTRQGKSFAALVSATLVRDAAGRPLMSRTVLIDYRNLQEQKRTLRRVLEAAPMAVRIADKKRNNVSFMNEAYCQLVQRDEEQARKLDVRTAYVDPRAFDDIASHLREGKPVFNRLIELHLPDRPSVPHVWALCSYMPIEYDGVPSTLAWLFDVTELHEARERAEQASRAKGAFLANMSHEIRTPLNAIVGLNHILRREATDGVQAARLDKVAAAAGHLLDVINNILDLSKIEAERMSLEAREFDLDDLLRRSIDLVRARADESALEFVQDCDHVPERLVGDPTRLSQMIVNLLANAVKFTRQGWIALRASRLASEGGKIKVRFEVQDTGPGIEADKQSQLFEAFEQGDNSMTRKYGGTGLGLALTRRFAEMMGGECGVHSMLGEGSTFWFTALFDPAAQRVGPRAPKSLAGKTVLLADDLPEALEAISGRLASFGMIVDQCSDGAQALSRISERAESGSPHDVAILDWHLPGLDGVEVARIVSRRLRDSVPPVIVTATSDDLAMRAQARHAGAKIVLIKPISGSALLEALLAAVEDREPRVEADRIHGAQEAGHAGRRVLVAEDNPINQEVACEMLRALGIEVEVAVDGAAAVQMVHAKHYDLVLMDMQMPVMDGLEATRRIRNESGASPTIVAMTANAFGEDRQMCLEAGMNDHLSKPVDPDQLHAVLKRWLPASGPEPALGRCDAPASPASAHGARRSEVPQALASVPGFDLDRALIGTNGNGALLLRLLEVFVAQYRLGEPNIRQALESAAPKALKDATHSFRGACAAVGAFALEEHAGAIEIRAQHEEALSASSDLALAVRNLDRELIDLVTSLGLAIGFHAECTTELGDAGEPLSRDVVARVM